MGYLVQFNKYFWLVVCKLVNSDPAFTMYMVKLIYLTNLCQSKRKGGFITVLLNYTNLMIKSTQSVNPPALILIRSQVSGGIATIFVYRLLASTWTQGVLNQQSSSLCTVNNLKHFNLSFSMYCEEKLPCSVHQTSWSRVCKPTSSDPALFGKCFWSNCN